MLETVKVIAKTGVYAYVASVLVETTGRFESDVVLVYRDKSVDAKSILGVMSLGIQPGATIEFKVLGVDAKDFITCLETELGNSFSKVVA